MKKVFLLILIVTICLSPLTAIAAEGTEVVMQGDTGSDVYAIQRRLCDLGYLNYRPTGKFSDMTVSAVRQFQQLNDIPADGQIGVATRQALFSEDAIRNTANPQFKKVVGKQYNGEVSRKGAQSAWETIDKIFPVGSTVTALDYNTGTSFRLTRTGGVNCAQVVTETPEDFENYTSVFGGESWEHRSVLVTIGGTEYAASLFGMPTNNSQRNFDNDNMDGYTILYFNNSKTDVYDIPDEEHVIALL